MGFVLGDIVLWGCWKAGDGMPRVKQWRVKRASAIRHCNLYAVSAKNSAINGPKHVGEQRQKADLEHF
jgi:hypothetical protein